jgi:hypothetical protein
MRRSAAIPMGGNPRSVKPSAQPTLVRTQHLPLAAKIARDLGDSLCRGLLLNGPRSSTVSMQVRLFPAVHGHIADSIGDHDGVPVSDGMPSACCEANSS